MVLRVNFGLRNIPLRRMEVIGFVLAYVTHLSYLYSVQCYRLDVFEVNVQIREFHTLDQQLDKPYLTTICPGG